MNKIVFSSWFTKVFFKFGAIYEFRIVSAAMSSGAVAVVALSISLALIVSCESASAANPFITMQYGADPAAHVFNGTLYVYASHDLNNATSFDMVDYHCYSTTDMINWTDNGVIFGLSQSGWAASNLWAPDCAYTNGKYYLYYPAEDSTGAFHIGVAVGPTPIGPFTDMGSPISGIPSGSGDPSVFIDTSGQAYIYWTNGGPYGCPLNSNMESLNGTPIALTGCANFAEGPWMFKRNSTYYFTYPAFMAGGSGEGGNGQYYDYATGTSPLGPFTYGGHFSRTFASEPQGGNIQGSQVFWNNIWYCFYHDFSMSAPYANSGFKRDLDVDVLNFNSNGSIQSLATTTTGPSPLGTLNPYIQCGANTLYQTPIPESPLAVQSETCSEGGIDVGFIKNGSWLEYGNVNFQQGANLFQAHVASPVGGCSIQIRLDSLTGSLVGTCQVPNTGNWQTWQTVNCAVSGATGVHNLFLVASGGSGFLYNIHWFQFGQGSAYQRMIGQYVSLWVQVNQMYVNATNNGANPLIANSSTVSIPETYYVQDMGNGSIALQALINHLWVCADDAGANPLIANRTSPSVWETYYVDDLSNNTISLEAQANNKWVCADNAGASPLIANRMTPGAWESFTFTPLSQNIVINGSFVANAVYYVNGPNYANYESNPTTILGYALTGSGSGVDGSGTGNADTSFSPSGYSPSAGDPTTFAFLGVSSSLSQTVPLTPGQTYTVRCLAASPAINGSRMPTGSIQVVSGSTTLATLALTPAANADFATYTGTFTPTTQNSVTVQINNTSTNNNTIDIADLSILAVP